MGSQIRATALWGYRELVHQLGGDANQFLSRFGIPRGADEQEGAFIGFEAYVHMLAASAEELSCPDFGLRLSKWHGLDVLGPIAVIARNARTVLDAADAIARYLYVHSPALSFARAPWFTGADVVFTLEATECGLPELAQGYEVGMAVAVRIIETLGGPGAVPATVSFLHDQIGTDAQYQEALGCPVRFGQTWCGSSFPPILPRRPSRVRTRRPGASPGSTSTRATCRRRRGCRSARRISPATCCRRGSAAST